MAKKAEKPKAIWMRYCHDFLGLGADIYQTGFPSLYGTDISITTFPPKKILTVGGVLAGDLENYFLICQVDGANRKRLYVLPGSEADTKLSLNCCFEGDSVDWDANSAFFREGELVAILSLLDSKGKRAPQTPSFPSRDNGLIEIYKSEIRRLARGLLHYKGGGDPFKELVGILKADSPRGKELHDSYRESIRSILR